MGDNSEGVTQKQPEELVGEMTEAEIDSNLAQSFPASDPPSWTLGTDHKGELPEPEKEDC